MPAFAVLEPPAHGDATVRHSDRFIFLHEKFSFSAFLFGPLWMIWHRLWLEEAAYMAGLAVVGWALYALGVGWLAIILIFGLIQLLLGLEATSLVRWMRVRRGWRDGGIVIADDLDVAERRFFDDRISRRTAVAGATASSTAAISSAPLPTPSAPPGTPPEASRPDVIGLFPQPGGGR
jgi:hypothetical protein